MSFAHEMTPKCYARPGILSLCDIEGRRRDQDCCNVAQSASHDVLPAEISAHFITFVTSHRRHSFANLMTFPTSKANSPASLFSVNRMQNATCEKRKKNDIHRAQQLSQYNIPRDSEYRHIREPIRDQLQGRCPQLDTTSPTPGRRVWYLVKDGSAEIDPA